jgi:hypothetical protein
VRVVVVIHRQPDLFQVVLALEPRCGLPHFLHCGQQQTNQDGNDGNDDEKLNQCKGASGHGNSPGVDREEQTQLELIERLQECRSEKDESPG